MNMGSIEPYRINNEYNIVDMAKPLLFNFFTQNYALTDL